MTNHIHLIATPQDELALSKAIGIAHKVYSTIINQKMNLSGHLWEGRFKSYPMNKAHLIQAARYIERNPVTAGMVTDPALYQWSSCRHHLGLCHDFLVDPACKLTEYIEEDWKSFIQQPCRKEFDLKIGYFINKGDLAGPLPKNDPGTTPDHPG